METCLNARSPPRNMRLWVKPHIYYTSKEVEKEWRDTLVTASLKLLATRIKYFMKVICTEKQTLDEIISQVTTELKLITKKPEKHKLKKIHTEKKVSRGFGT